MPAVRRAIAASPGPHQPTKMEQQVNTTTYLGRQPILDNSQQIVAYELLYRRGSQGGAAVQDASQATAQVLLNTFSTMGAQQVLGSKLGFINFGRELLESDLVYLLPKERVVLEILEDVEPDAELIRRCRQLREEGYRFALDDFIHRDDLMPLVEIAEVLKLDITQHDALSLREHVRLARSRGLRTLAEKVEDKDQVEQCRALGMDYYQGYYFARPVTLEQSDIPSLRLSVIRGLNLIMADAELGELEALISRDAGLSYKLLRYINCAGMAGLSKIDSIRQAMVRMGRQQLYRLLTLLLFANEGEGPSSPLLLTALQRGRLLEQLGQGSERGNENELFVVGMFSMLEALLHMPMTRIAEEMVLPDSIRTALLERRGPYAPYLALVEALERCDWAQMQRLAGELGMAEEAINAAALEALAYSEKLA